MSNKNSWESLTDDLGGCMDTGCLWIVAIIAVIAFVLLVPSGGAIVSFCVYTLLPIFVVCCVVGLIYAIFKRPLGR